MTREQIVLKYRDEIMAYYLAGLLEGYAIKGRDLTAAVGMTDLRRQAAKAEELLNEILDQATTKPAAPAAQPQRGPNGTRKPD